MSLESLFVGQSGQLRLEHSLVFEQLIKEIRLLRDFTAQPFIFLKSTNNELSSNVADGVIIARGPSVPPGHRATVRDFNLSFITAAGTVRIVVLAPGGAIRQDVLRGITATSNGVGETVLDEGESLAVAGQTAGAGTFNVFCSGSKQRFREDF